jgi:hypothetical protein
MTRFDRYGIYRGHVFGFVARRQVPVSMPVLHCREVMVEREFFHVVETTTFGDKMTRFMVCRRTPI